MLASAGEDKKVFIWRQAAAGGEWVKQALPTFAAPVWRVSWSVTGNLLAVSCGDNSASLWKETLTGAWEQVSDITPDAALPAPVAAGSAVQG
jgi:protein transport protein SEC13